MKDSTLSGMQKLFIRISLTLIVYFWIFSYGVCGQTLPSYDLDSVLLPDINTFEKYYLTPNDTFLANTIERVNEGKNAEAMRILQQARPYPIVFYWLAWLNRTSSPEKSSYYLQQAEEMSPDPVFTFRPESIQIFNWAMDKQDSWKTKYYLGLLYWHQHLPEKAMDLFEQCGDIPEFAPFYVARAILFRNSDREYCMPCSDYDRAVILGPEDWRTWHFLTNFLQVKGAFQEQLVKSKEAYSYFPENPFIAADYTRALKNSKK